MSDDVSLLADTPAPDAPDVSPDSHQVHEDDGEPDGAPEAAPAEPPAKGPVSLTGTQLVQLRALRQAQRQAQYEMEDAKSALKIAKANYDAKTDAISAYIDAQCQELPLFDAAGGAAVDASYTLPDGTHVGMDVTTPPAEDWREVTLADAIGHRVSAGILKSLTAAELLTVGDLADYSAVQDCHLVDIEGIGPAKATQIEEAMEAFWASRKAAGADPEDEPTGDEDEAHETMEAREGDGDAADE